MITFDVIDPKTGEYPDLEEIARTEEWVQNLIYCDMDGFCINEDGNLLLMDECGNYAYCPPDRFKVTFDFPVYSGGGGLNMVGTVKQFKDMIEEMRSIYPFDDEKAYMSTHDLVTHENSRLQIQVKDEKTGVLIVMEKYVPDIQF